MLAFRAGVLGLISCGASTSTIGNGLSCVQTTQKIPNGMFAQPVTGETPKLSIPDTLPNISS